MIDKNSLISFCSSLILVGCLGLPFGPAVAVETEPPITDLAFSRDGTRVVASSQRGLITLDWPELQVRRTLGSTASNLHCLAFSQRGDRLAVGGGWPTAEGIVEIRSWPDGQVIQTISEQSDSVLDVTWIDEQTIVAASLDHSIIVVDLPTGRVTARLQGHSRGVSAMVHIPQESMLVSAGLDQSLRVWDLTDGRLSLNLDHHTQPVQAIAHRPVVAGLVQVATAGDDQTVRFWQPSIGRMVRFARLDSTPLDLAWLNDGTAILASCADGRVRWIDPTTVKVVADSPAIQGWAYAIAIHPHEGSLVVAGENGQVICLPTRKN